MYRPLAIGAYFVTIKELFINLNEKAPNSLKVKGFCGPDGTRTRDLRRDRAAF